MIKYKEYGIQPNDTGGYVVGIVKTDEEKGKETLTKTLYPSTLARAVEIIREREIAKCVDSKDLTLEEAIKEIKNIDADIKAAIKEAL